MTYITTVSSEQQKKEKQKARDLRKSLWWRQFIGKGTCYHCEQKFSPEELTMDHLIPIARGGKSDKKNCVPSCKDCNTKKGHLTKAELILKELNKTKE